MGRLLKKIQSLTTNEQLELGTDSTIKATDRQHTYGGRVYVYTSPRFQVTCLSEPEAHRIAKDVFGYELRFIEMREHEFTEECLKEVRDRFASSTKS